MLDNFTPRSRGPRASSVVNYRPENEVLYAKRVISVSEVIRPRVEAATTSTTSVSHQTPSQTHHTAAHEAPSYRSYEVDEVFAKIAAIEAETPFNASVSLATASASMGAAVVDTVRVEVKRTTSWLRYVVTGVVAMIVLALTGYVSIDTWITNSEVKQVVSERQATVSAVVLGEGEDESEVTDTAIDRYTVAGDLPRVLTIDSLGVRARVLPMSVNADGAMQAPVNIFDSGWYGASAKPGTPGATVIDAHASGATREGLFAYLDTLTIGDELSLERGDGQTFTYRVTHTETIPLNEVDMTKLLTPYGTATEGVNLITCTGSWLPDQKTYDHRVMVYTERV